MRFTLPCLAFLAAACYASPGGVSPSLASCAPADIAFASGTGTASVEGQAFLKTRGGDVKYGAGNGVELVPVCDGSTAWAAKQGKYFEPFPLDTTLTRATRTTTSDGEGRFRFQNVPPGDYYVVSSVTWDAPTRYGAQKQGGVVLKQVHAENGQTASVILSEQ